MYLGRKVESHCRVENFDEAMGSDIITVELSWRPQKNTGSTRMRHPPKKATSSVLGKTRSALFCQTVALWVKSNRVMRYK